MSRLDSFIRRMSAQRDILDDLVPRLDGITGPIYEFGLGSGRTYDHLHERFPDRRIVVFESVQGTGPCRPDDLVIGDLRDTTAHLDDGCAALIHADIETGVADIDAVLADWLPSLVARLLARGGYAVSGCALPNQRLAERPLPPGIAPGRYHLVQRL